MDLSTLFVPTSLIATVWVTSRQTLFSSFFESKLLSFLFSSSSTNLTANPRERNERRGKDPQGEMPLPRSRLNLLLLQPYNLFRLILCRLTFSLFITFSLSLFIIIWSFHFLTGTQTAIQSSTRKRERPLRNFTCLNSLKVHAST